MKTIKQINEDLELTKTELIGWAMNAKRYGTFWQRNWLNFFMYGLLIVFAVIFQLIGWWIFARILMFMLGLMLLRTLWGLIVNLSNWWRE